MAALSDWALWAIRELSALAFWTGSGHWFCHYHHLDPLPCGAISKIFLFLLCLARE